MLRDVFYYGSKPNVHPRERYADSLTDAIQKSTTDSFWIINEFCDYRNFDWDFDFELLPDEDIWAIDHNNVWPSQHQKDSGTWLCPKEHSDIIIYRGDVDPVIRRNIKTSHWVELDTIDHSKFDFSWHPDPTDPPYVYKWGCKFFPATVKPVLEYHVPGATADKYMSNIVELLPTDYWVEHQTIDKTKFDMTWRPNPMELPYIYIWGNKHIDVSVKPTLAYHTPGATVEKHMTELVALLPEWDKWVEVQNVDKTKFDFTWRPSPYEPPYIHTWGNKWIAAEEHPTLEYHAEGATDRKYMTNDVPVLPENDRWKILKAIDEDSFDFTWRPDPKEPPFMYIFGNHLYDAVKMPTVMYTVPNSTEIKYINDIKAKLLPDMTNWEVPNNLDHSKFDFSWCPDPDAPAYIYQFATLLDDIWVDDGPRYITPNNDGTIVRLENSILYAGEVVYPRYMIETTLEDLVNEHPTEQFWALNKNINYDNFDFTWKPSKDNLFNVTVFGSTESELTHTYFVNASYYLNGYKEFNFIQPTTELDIEYLANIFVKPDMFYVDRGNNESIARFESLKMRFPHIQKTRYLNSWVDTINRCTNRSTTEMMWVLNSELDYSDFNFEYYPNPWQMKMVHVFGTQWSHWGTTFMINRDTFAEDTKYIKIIEHLSNLNFVKDRRAKSTICLHDIVMIDHGNKEIASVTEQVEKLSSRKILATIKYEHSYLNTLQNYIKQLPNRKEYYLWICSSVCDYSKFDFTYICDPFSKDNLHVFPSDIQKFGDTFLIDVSKTKVVIDELEKLEDYNKVNFNGTIKTTRLPEPIIVTCDDTHVDAITRVAGWPYATLITNDNVGLETSTNEPMNLWATDTKNIIVTSTGATRIIVPIEAKDIVKKELYDYPYIKKTTKLAKSKPIDIVFLSNGETSADENYEHLLNVTEGLPNRVVRVDGVNGRAAAYHAAAEASETPWMFTVFAKLKVNPKFDWTWQPDRMQIPKHYIFHAKNPVNGLIYGHQAMIAYNKKLTLANEGRGLDFTLDDEHEVVPLISGTALYNTDPFSTWRTAFREVLKLKADDSEESRVRLDAWLNKAEGEFAEYSIKGSTDASKYYDEVSGDFDALKLSYEWAWLRERYENL